MGRTKADRILADMEQAALFALEHLHARGVDHAECSAAQGSRLEVSVRMDDVELVKEATSSGLSVRVIHGDRVATSSTTNLDRDALASFLDRTVEMAELSEPDPLAVPPDPAELGRRLRELDLYDPKTGRIGADRAIRIARSAERAALKTSKKITASEGASFVRGTGHSVLVTSGGFAGRHSGSSSHVVVQVIADDADGKKRNGSDWTAGRFFEDLDRPSDVGRRAAKKAIAQLGSRKMETGVVPVVFSNEASGRILGLLASCILGDSVYREQSYLRDRLGTRVASDLVHIVDDPFVARGAGSRPFDGEGRASRKNVVVKKGQLERFLLDTYSARKLRMDATASAGGGGGIPYATTSNFIMRNGRSKPESLLRGVERGLYVTDMMGFGFNAVSGSFSRGAAGFEIVDGELGDPISEITISRNLDEILQGIDRVANDLRLRSSTEAPSFRVDHMTVSGA